MWTKHILVSLGNSATWGFLVIRSGGLRVLRFMKGHAGRAEHIVAHLTVFSVGIAQLTTAIRAFLASSCSGAGNAVSVS
jgi:hypothetical protein